MDFVVPIVNPEKAQINIWDSMIARFDHYFFNPEAGVWFDYWRIDGLSSSVLQIIFVISVIKAFMLIVRFLKQRFEFRYSQEEKEKVIFVAFVTCQAATLLMHVVSSTKTLIDTIYINRYNFMFNGVLCGILFIAGTKIRISETEQKYIGVIINAFYAFLITAMCCGYIQIIWLM